MQWIVLGGSAALPAEEPATAASTNVTYKIAPGVIHEFPVPLTAAAKLGVVASKNPAVEMAKAGIVVPFGFDPAVSTPILVVCGTSDGDASSLRHMRAYTNIALRLGWVVVAADGPFGKPLNDSPPWRWAMLSSVLEHVHKAWPRSRRWPVAVAGFSGGGKWAGVIGAILSQKGYNLIGVFMGGVNQDLASESANLYYPASRFKKTPIFISSGTEDKVATPQHHTEVKESMQDHGFKNVRLESYKGSHELVMSELRTALRWFIEQYSKPEESPKSEPVRAKENP